MNQVIKMNSRPNIIQGSFERNVFTRLLGKARSWYLRRQAIRELQAMPDSLLRDLGIERFQIVDVVNSPGSFAKVPATVSNKAVVAPLQKAAA